MAMAPMTIAQNGSASLRVRERSAGLLRGRSPRQPQAPVSRNR
jgi:hypothetical protein